MFHEHLTKNTVEVGITWHLAFDTIPACINELMDECFNVLQVTYLLDTEDDEAVPLPSMPVSEMPFDSTEEVGSQANVVETVPTIERVDASVTAHDLSEAPCEQWAIQYLAR